MVIRADAPEVLSRSIERRFAIDTNLSQTSVMRKHRSRFIPQQSADIEFHIAVANLCMPVADEGLTYSQRMVALLVDGLRYGADLQRS